MNWSPNQYTVFEDQRTRPVRDLLRAVPTADVMTAIDLGCGSGNSTEILVDSFPNASVSGIDSSVDMIEAARKRLPKCQFTVKPIESWNGPGSLDVILANAALHWVPNHTSLLPRLIKFLSSHGSLAIQMPDNLNEPAHRLMCEIALEQPWADKLAKSAGERTTVESVDWYYWLLRPLCSRVDIWRTTYHHSLAGGAAVVEWFKGSGLRPFLLPLNDVERERYLSQYRAAVSDAYQTLSDGTVLLPFPRLFIVATR